MYLSEYKMGNLVCFMFSGLFRENIICKDRASSSIRFICHCNWSRSPYIIYVVASASFCLSLIPECKYSSPFVSTTQVIMISSTIKDNMIVIIHINCIVKSTQFLNQLTDLQHWAYFPFLKSSWKLAVRACLLLCLEHPKWFATSIWRIPACTIPTVLSLSCWRRRGIEKRAKLCGKFLSPFAYICPPDI